MDERTKCQKWKNWEEHFLCGNTEKYFFTFFISIIFWQVFWQTPVTKNISNMSDS